MSEMSNPTFGFIQKMFLKYYTECFDEVCIPYLFEKREFGVLLLKEKIMIRHKSFKDAAELRNFLCSTIPSDAYYSTAYYEQPGAPEMDAKGWFGADLIFDIDADHIPTPCDKVHDEWTCDNCGFAGKGDAPGKCPVCGGEKIDVSTWPCEVCLTSAKEETVKLLDMLMQDFGFSDKEIKTFFSGHRGYHIHVEGEAIKTLDAVARKEIVDYVSGLGLDVFLHGLSEKNRRAMHAYRGSHLDDFGWRKRMAEGMQNFIYNAKEQDLRNIGLRKKVVEAILRNKDAILKSWLDRGTSGIRGLTFETWRKIAEQGVKLQCAKIDTVVTTDIHRLIRLPCTLHGKTGLKKVEFPVSTINNFDPFKSAIAFKDGTIRVFVSDAPEFRLGDEIFGPYKHQKVALPSAAAVLLICKGKAEAV